MIMFIFPGGKENGIKITQEEGYKVRMACGACMLMWIEAALPGLDTLVMVLRKYWNSALEETHLK